MGCEGSAVQICPSRPIIELTSFARFGWSAALSARFCDASANFSAISSPLFSSSSAAFSAASNTPFLSSTICYVWCAGLESEPPERPLRIRRRQAATGKERSGYVSSQFTLDEAALHSTFPLRGGVDKSSTAGTGLLYAFAKSVLPYAKEPPIILLGRHSNARRVVCLGGSILTASWSCIRFVHRRRTFSQSGSDSA